MIGEPTDYGGAAQLAAEDKYQFQWWALGQVGASPADQKKGADRGIDGRLYFHEEGSVPCLFTRRQSRPESAAALARDATASGNGLSGDSSDQSSSQAKKRRNARRWPVSYSRIVPRSMG